MALIFTAQLVLLSCGIISVCSTSTSTLWRRQFRYDFYTLRTTSKAKISVCMQGSNECSPVCVHILELFVQVSTAVWCATKCGVMSHNTLTIDSITSYFIHLASEIDCHLS